MFRRYYSFVLFVLFFVHLASGVVHPPHARIHSVWAYNENVTDSLRLDYKHNNLRFYCSTVEGYPRDSVSYRYMLKGFDNEWITTTDGRRCFYTDIPPGKYVFVVQGKYGSGSWGPEAMHDITIVSPWWRTGWAYTVYLILLAGTLGYIFYLVRGRFKIRQQLLIEQQNLRFRSDFIIHAVRELRTPLTVIRSTVEKLNAETNNTLSRSDIQHLRNSSRTMLQQLENLAEFKREDPGQTVAEEIGADTDAPMNRDITVLVVETNPQLADLIATSLSQYMVTVIVDGKEAVAKAEQTEPSAIVIDTELAGSDPYAILKDLKKSPATAAIPVILISDFDNSRSLMRAIRSEADDYLQKPFNCEVLAIMILKKIRYAKTLTDEEDTRPRVEPPKAVRPQDPIFEKRSDKLFLEKLDKLILANMAEQDFDVNALSDRLGISRANLYNKIKSLRGVTPVEYLREMRLLRAAELLRDGANSVKKVRYEVGMPDATNFNRRFKEKFEISPTEFRHREMGKE